MRMNMSKVLVGGVIAGIVMLVVDFISNMYILGPKANAEMEAFKPGLSATMQQGSGMIGYIFVDVILGIVLIWVYAAIRPRFGPGPKTAFIAAVMLWLVSCVSYYGYLQMGMMSTALWSEFALVGLISLSLAAMAGAKFYSEDIAT
ncbi:MAG: hypothetical protein H0W63_10440 [Gemmatimonadaceae bacterium]|nr:hypothetical protein [Gemmatimonadaceae bacterium]